MNSELDIRKYNMLQSLIQYHTLNYRKAKSLKSKGKHDAYKNKTAKKLEKYMVRKLCAKVRELIQNM